MTSSGEHEQLFILFAAIILVVVFGFMVSYVNKVAGQDLIQRGFVASDSSSLINSIFSAPGNVFYTYQQFLISPVDYSFQDDLVISHAVDGKHLVTKYSLFKDPIFKFQATDASDKFSIQNSGYELIIGSDVKKDLSLYKYPLINTKKENVKISVKSGSDSLIRILNNLPFVEVVTDLKKADFQLVFSPADKDDVFYLEIPFNKQSVKHSRKFASLTANQFEKKPLIVPSDNSKIPKVTFVISNNLFILNQEQFNNAVLNAVIQYYG